MAEADVTAPDITRRPSHRTLQYPADPLPRNGIRGRPDRVFAALGPWELVNIGVRAGGVAMVARFRIPDRPPGTHRHVIPGAESAKRATSSSAIVGQCPFSALDLSVG